MKQLPRQILTLCALACAPHANAALTLYGVLDGVSKSTDGGLTWKQTIIKSNDPKLLGNAETRGIIVDPQNPSNVYATALYGGASAVLRSTDAARPGRRSHSPRYPSR